MNERDLREKLALHGLSMEQFTPEELRQIEEELEAEENGYIVVDGLLHNQGFSHRR